MTAIYVARNIALGKWASDVGLGKHIYRVGLTADPPKPVVAAAHWAGEGDWRLVIAREGVDLDEATMLARIGAREKEVDPVYYPRLKGLRGLFRVSPVHVSNGLLIQRTLAGEAEIDDFKLKPADFGDYLIRIGLGDTGLLQS